MSFISLATLTFHRRHELESRIKVLDQKCDRAIDDLKKIKMKAHGFPQQLNCDSSELKEKFLTLMKTLDEYTYLVTDFNLAISQMEDFNNFEFAPVQDQRLRPILKALPPAQIPLTPTITPLTPTLTPSLMPQTVTPDAPSKPPNVTNHAQTSQTPHSPNHILSAPPHSPIMTPTPALTPLNLIDALSECTPSTSCTCSNNCPPEKQKAVKIPKEEQVLIAFSSSTSSESIPNKKSEMVTKEVQCEINDEMEKLAVEDCRIKNESINQLFKEPQETSQNEENLEETCRLPAASLLKADHKYDATIMSVDGTCFWVVTDCLDEVQKFMTEMTDYYMSNSTQLSAEDFKSLTICAYYDDESDCFYRALYLKPSEADSNNVELFVVDTGELRSAPVDCVQPLMPQFRTRPPYARCCYLAGIDLQMQQDKIKEQEALISTYIGRPCTIEVDDDTSESLGVYVRLPSGETINEILVQQGLAVPIDKIEPSPPKQVVIGPPEMRRDSELEVDMMDQPEHEDPVVAVTGYHNRDEMDICKHYKGGPEKTCFKGKRCTKRHVAKHPDGWTLDRVEVPTKLVSLPLPAPDTWLDVVVTSVCHFDRLYVQIYDEDKEENVELPEFGVILPPTTLKQLQRDLNSPATVLQLKPLTLTPSPGELVVAIYPLDNCWYRARVISVMRSDQSVQIMYVDYGTVLYVKEDQIRQLEPRFMRLPAQAMMCVLAGVVERSREPKQWVAAKKSLAEMVQDKKVTAHVIARDFDEITVELIDEEGYNVAQQLAALELVKLEQYSIIEDVPRRITVP